MGTQTTSRQEFKRQSDMELLGQAIKIADQLETISPVVKELVEELIDIHVEQLVRAEDNAIRSHGRQILAAIEGTTWVSEAGSRIGVDENDSALVQMLDREVAS